MLHMLKMLLTRFANTESDTGAPLPANTRPKCPYTAGWPLANAWHRGVLDAMNNRYTDASVAYRLGHGAGMAYIRSGQALQDRRNAIRSLNAA